MEDLVELACQNDEAEKAFTEYVHDKNFNIMYKSAEWLLSRLKGKKAVSLI